MIDVVSTIDVSGVELTLFGKMDEKMHCIELNYQITSPEAMKLGEQLMHGRKFNLQLTDMTARMYSIYGCKINNTTMSFAQSSVVVIKGSFERLIREDNLEKQYESVVFSFLGIEQVFPLAKFSTEFEDESSLLRFTKERENSISYQLPDESECVIKSKFHNVTRSNDLVNLEIKQEKVIQLIYKCKKSVDELLVSIEKIKTFFEFILKQEITICLIEFVNTPTGGYSRGLLLYDTLLHKKTNINLIAKNSYRGSNDDLFNGLIEWIRQYDKYYEVIEIWKKTIYNSHISKEDLFLWRCQAFELLCIINPHIKAKSISLKTKKQANPNLKNFLTAVTEIYKISTHLDSRYFRDLKDVRDKLTHNDPQKKISEDQKFNSYELIEHFFVKTFSKVNNIEGMSTDLGLKHYFHSDPL